MTVWLSTWKNWLHKPKKFSVKRGITVKRLLLKAKMDLSTVKAVTIWNKDSKTYQKLAPLNVKENIKLKIDDIVFAVPFIYVG